jgi:RNA polymerase sigma factor (sigma-70 family)
MPTHTDVRAPDARAADARAADARAADARTTGAGGTDRLDVIRLVHAGVDGSETAWNEMLRRYTPLVMYIIRSYQLTAEDASDVRQTVWLRLVEHLADLHDPQALPRWLAAITRHECCRQLRHGQRVLPTDPHADDTAWRPQPGDLDPDAGILQAELRQAMRDGLDQLPTRDQQLLRLRADDPPAPYSEISQLLGMPVGSIGPTLRRCLDRLRETAPMQAYLAA